MSVVFLMHHIVFELVRLEVFSFDMLIAVSRIFTTGGATTSVSVSYMGLLLLLDTLLIELGTFFGIYTYLWHAGGFFRLCLTMFVRGFLEITKGR